MTMNDDGAGRNFDDKIDESKRNDSNEMEQLTDDTGHQLVNGKRESDVNSDDCTLTAQRVYKKTSPNGKLTLYLSTRDLVVAKGYVDRLQGVLLVEPDYVQNKKVYGQITLTFRYGREDEEVMGLKFCNEAIMCLAQLYPPHSSQLNREPNTPIQEALLKRLGPNAYPFTLEITPLAPPSVQLVPAKEYNGAPIGTSYDVRAYIAERADDKLLKKSTVRMGLRVIQHVYPPPSPTLFNPDKSYDTEKKRGGAKHTLFNFNKQTQQIEINNFKTKCREGAERVAKITDKRPSDTRDQSKELKGCMTTKRGGHEAVIVTDDTTTTTIDTMKNPQILISKSRVDFDLNEQENDNGNGGAKVTNGTKNCLKEKNDNIQRIGLTSPGRARTLLEPPCMQSGSRGECEILSKAEYYNEIEKLSATLPAPRATAIKRFLMSDGHIELDAALDKAIYSHGDSVCVQLRINNHSHKTVRRIKVFIVQHVDVCMFSNGKFKNVVAQIDGSADCPVAPQTQLTRVYQLTPLKSETKNWIALEDSYTKSGTNLASTVCAKTARVDDAKSHATERNVFAIYVSYYVKIKLMISVTSGEIALKLPFTLVHSCNEAEYQVSDIHDDTTNHIERKQSMCDEHMDTAT